jgi:hypothetical protein
MTMYLKREKEPGAFYKYGPTPANPVDHWYEFDFDKTTGTGAKFNGRKVTLHFVDGERGDSDNAADGSISITDPGAPGFAPPLRYHNICFIAASSGQASPLNSAPVALILLLTLCLVTELLAYKGRR